MSILDIIYTIFIMPLQLAFETLYTMTNTVIDNPGLSIVALSLMMNFLVLPLYMRADAMQEHERDMENRLRHGVNHIKKTFKGNEKSMMLSTYYRQNGYKPTDVFKGSISLFLEIPFFISAYMFLSHLEILQGVQFWFLPDLGAPDGLINISGFSINLMPFVMTGINLISCILFTKGMPTKTKVQLYGMALFFLVFLYASPSGLVFYWTLNNVFALVKTIFYKLKHPKQVLMVLFALAGVAFVVYGMVFLPVTHPTASIVVTVFGFGCMVPLAVMLANMKRGGKRQKAPSDKLSQPSMKRFVSGALFLTVLVGLLIPSAVISSSPAEFVDLNRFSDPVWFVVSSLCLAFGMFIVWFGVFYWLCKPKAKLVFEAGIWAFCAIALMDYMFFGTNLGTLSSTLQFQNGMSFSTGELLLNTACVVVVAVAVVLLARRKGASKVLVNVFIVGIVAVAGMGVYNIVSMGGQTAELAAQSEANSKDMPKFTLSKTGKNVIVFMLDRAMGEYVPYIMDEKPELAQRLSGFTYYSNTISFGAFTNFATPALFGGYEYTPEELNKRNDELLVDKQNEALKVMPVLFDENGFDVTVCDPTYANYSWNPDTSIYDEYPDIKTYTTAGKFDDAQTAAQNLQQNMRNFFCYGIVKSMPLCTQKVFYANGTYNSSKTLEQISEQVSGDSPYVADGLSSAFMKPYQVLCNLDKMTTVTDDGSNTFMMITNDTTHEPMMLQEPQYEPVEHVDNTAYEESQGGVRTAADEPTLDMQTSKQMTHYQANVASLERIADWVDHLKAQGVYDNTRIILVADHGRDTRQLENMYSQDQEDPIYDYEFYYPLLMVKDFGSTEFETSDQFMTNGDVPTLATAGLISNPVNPFTGKAIDSSAKNAPEQHVFGSLNFDVNVNNGTTFAKDGTWFAVSNDMRDKANWRVIPDPSGK